MQGDRRIAARVSAQKEDFVGLAVEGGLVPGEAVVELRWSGPIEPLSTRGLFRQKEGDAWYAVTQLEAMNARRVLPCFDEPGWKTRWRLTIDAPEADRAVSNTPIETSQPVADRPGWRRHAFAAKKPLPSYLLALAVGPYDIVDGGTAGRQSTPLRYVAGRGRGAEARFAKAATPRLLASLEDYFGRP